MDAIKVIGGNSLRGKICISGSKNAALPAMAASILTEDTLILSNIPNLSDIITMNNLLINHGVELSVDGSIRDNRKNDHTILLNAKHINNLVAPYEIVRKMRASVLVLGPLLARFGEAKVSLPGGCAIGIRPINLHLYAFEQLGAEIILENGYITAKAKNGLTGNKINFDVVSVGATENALMAATLAKGKTIITNAATEPEITDLANLLVTMGANIEGIGTSTLIINGVKKLHGGHHKIIGDRIVAGSYAIAAAVTDGELELTDIEFTVMENIAEKISQTGVCFEKTEGGIKVYRKGTSIKPVDLATQAYPGFPTDMQAQYMLLMSVADGVSTITENIFENRFMHVPELCRMGANISINGHTATVRGVKNLTGANVMASDLRASISLVIAGLYAKGETQVNRVYHLDRGYESVEQKLFSCGAIISRVHNS